MKRAHRQSGFVLVLVLLAVAVCGTVLAGSARRSGQNALAAAAATRDLQVRWGASSCRHTVLPAAERILLERARAGGTPPVEVASQVVLGGVDFQLVVSDESAKANMNCLAQRYESDTTGLLAAISRLQAGGPRVLPVELRPAGAVAAGGSDLPVSYRSFDQVFPTRHWSELINPPADEALARRRMTFWGGGLVNLRRAERAVLREVLAGHVTESQLAALESYRRSHKDFRMRDALAHLQLSQEQAAVIGLLAGENSDCHALWLVARGGSRSWCRLYVQQSGDAAAHAHTEQASRLLEEGKLAEAEKELRAALAAEPLYGPAHNALGALYYRQKNYYLAAREFQDASVIMPRKAEPRNNLGLVLEAAGRLEQAVTAYEQALALEPSSAEIIGNLARALVRLGRNDERVRRLLHEIVTRDTRPEWTAWARERLAIMGTAAPMTSTSTTAPAGQSSTP